MNFNVYCRLYPLKQIFDYDILIINESKTKISIILFIIILVVGLYPAYEANRAANKLNRKVIEALTAKVNLFYIVTSS
jgi:hypothetical protein